MSKERFYKSKKMPEQLFEDIENLGLSKGDNGFQMKALHFISILIDKSNRKMGKRCDYFAISRDYFVEVFGYRYFTFLNALRDSEIILCKYVASADAGRPNEYAINPKYFKGTPEMVMRKITYKTDKEKDLTEQDRQSLIDFKLFYNTLTINEDKLFQRLYQKIDTIDKEVYKYNEKVDAKLYDKIQYSNGIITKHAYVHQLVDKAYKSDKNLIQDGADYFFMKEDDYKAMKKHHIDSTWSSSIKDLAEGNLRAIRDRKGRREHTNLTNFPTELRELLFEDSKIANEDISNSQFAFLTMIGRKQGLNSLDADRFFTACEKGEIYEVVQEELGLAARKDAKQAMFLMNFSNNNYRSVNKSKFIKRFPSVANYISDYKDANGSKAFPLMLQRVEADYILNRVRPRLREMGIIATSIHDSICVAEEHKETARRVMREVAEEIGLKAVIKDDEPQQEIQIFKDVA